MSSKLSENLLSSITDISSSLLVGYLPLKIHIENFLHPSGIRYHQIFLLHLLKIIVGFKIYTSESCLQCSALISRVLSELALV